MKSENSNPIPATKQNGWHKFAMVCFCLTVCIAIFVVSCSNPDQMETSNPEYDRYYLNRTVTEESAHKVEAFCGHCHNLPKPENFPVDAWKKEVERGFDFYAQSGRSDLIRPNVYDTIAYFTQKAPTREEFFAAAGKNISSDKLDSGFDLHQFDSDRDFSATANVEFINGDHSFVLCDMLDGQVYLNRMENPEVSSSIHSAQAPVNSTICDLNEDGKLDVLVADIGDYKATDSKLGKIVWLQPTESGFKPTTIADGLGRVCQTIAQDFDNDGDTDILVAEFGYFQTGSIFLLRRDAQPVAAQSFTKIVLDSRPGTVRMQAFDFDADGDLDFVACIAQEYETVELFLNDGKGSFLSKSIFSADFPSYGISGLEIVDLDGDGDQDILFTNGDTFDSMLPKKYHSIQWLENLGKREFKRHFIASMPGVHCAKSADFDNDGDIDIVACAFMSNKEHPLDLEAVVYLSNDGEQVFKKSWIEKSKLHYPNLNVGDFNGDGRMDFVLGTAVLGDRMEKEMPLRIYLNRFPPKNTSDANGRPKNDSVTTDS